MARPRGKSVISFDEVGAASPAASQRGSKYRAALLPGARSWLINRALPATFEITSADYLQRRINRKSCDAAWRSHKRPRFHEI